MLESSIHEDQAQSQSRLKLASETEEVGGTTYVFPTYHSITKHSQAIAIGI